MKPARNLTTQSMIWLALLAGCTQGEHQPVSESTTSAPVSDANEASAPREPFDEAFLKASTGLQSDFYDACEEFRPDLYRYCLGLTGSPWDAEDLCQESLAKAMKASGESHYGVGKPKAFLFRVATNTWIDQMRRYRPELMADAGAGAVDETPDLSSEVRDALVKLSWSLPPKQRVAVLLKDAFAFSHAEVATLLNCSESSAKVSLHRARATLKDAKESEAPQHVGNQPEALIDAFVEAFNARDVERLVALMHADGETEILGMVEGYSAGVNRGVMEHTVDDPRLVGARVAEFRGEKIVILLYKGKDASGKEVEQVRDIVRLEGYDTTCTRMRFYYFSPETIEAVASELGLGWKGNGYRYTGPSGE